MENIIRWLSLLKFKFSCIIKEYKNNIFYCRREAKKMKQCDNAYPALDIARYVVNKCHDLESPISNLKLQKILYFIQGNFYKIKNKECFIEDIHAWDYGPVVPDVYREFKCFGSNEIPKIDKVYSINMETFSFEEKEFNQEFNCDDDRQIIDEVIEMCRNYNANALVAITHKQLPWKNAYRRGQDCIIEKESIKGFFENGN